MHSRSMYSQSKCPSFTKTTDLIISHLLLVQSQSRLIQKSFIDKLSKIHESLHSKSFSILKELNSFSTEIDSLISSIRKGNFDVTEGSLARCMSLPLDQASMQVQRWNLIVEEMNIDGIMREIWKLQGFTNNLMKLYMDDEFDIQPKQMPIQERKSNSFFELQKSFVTKDSNYETQNDQNKKSQVIKSNGMIYCNNNHLLRYDNLTHFTYWNTKKNFIITCGVCNEKISEGTWNCSDCCFDVCKKCANRANIQTPSLECSLNHNLEWKCDYPNQLVRNFTCNDCKLVVSNIPRWNCKACNYNICMYCGVKARFNPPISGPKCTKAHDLVSKYIIYDENNIKMCKNCNSVVVDDSYHCEPCNIYLCVECSHGARYPLAAHPIAACNNGHITIWNTSRYKCSYCGIISEDGFFCFLCRYKICILCCDYLTHEAVSLVLEKYLDVQLYWNPRCNNLKFKKKCIFCKDEMRDNGFFSTKNENSQVCLICFQNPGRQDKSQQPKKKSVLTKLGLFLLKSLNEKDEKN